MTKILIVDDIQGWRDYNSNIVQELYENPEIVTADSAKNAYDILLSGENFDVIITDLQMEDDFLPKFAGEWLIEQIRTFSRYMNTKIVIISASFNARRIAEAMHTECIPKYTALKCLSAYKEVLDIK